MHQDFRFTTGMAYALADNLLETKLTMLSMAQQMNEVSNQLQLLREQMDAMHLQQTTATALILAAQLGHCWNSLTHLFK